MCHHCSNPIDNRYRASQATTAELDDAVVAAVQSVASQLRDLESGRNPHVESFQPTTCYLSTCVQAPTWEVSYQDQPWNAPSTWLACEKHMTNCVGHVARTDPESKFVLEFTRL